MKDLLEGLRAAGETTRLRLLALLLPGELNVSDITSILGQSQPRVSRHLKLLCDAGLLSRYTESQWVVYRIAETGAGSALAHAIVAQIPKGDPLVARDRERVEHLRRKRAEEAERYFRASAASWDRIRELHVAQERIEQLIFEALGDDEIDTLLDLGTGTGRVLELLANRCRIGIGVDYAQEMLNYARAKLDHPKFSHLQVRHGDITKLPYEDGLADLAICHQVLHYLSDPGAAIHEAARLLKPGGRLLMVDFAPHDLDYLREFYAHRRLGISADQMDGWLAEAGLNISLFAEFPPIDGDEADGLTVSLWLADKPEIDVEKGSTRAASKLELA